MRKKLNISAYLVIGPENTKGRPVASIIKDAIEAGFTCIQIRSKVASARELIHLTKVAAEVIDEAGKSDVVALLVNDRLDVVLAAREQGIKVDGIHVGQADIPADVCRKYLGENSIVGISARSDDLFDYIQTENVEPIDYFGIGPLRETATKPDCGQTQDGKRLTLSFSEISKIASVSPIPVVIGGGVKLPDIPELTQTGVHGFFVVSAVTEANHPRQAAMDLVNTWKSNLKKEAYIMKTSLTIAGSDSSGGAGIQADIKTMTANNVYAMSAITALTAQNTTGVLDIMEVTPEFLGLQLDSVFTDIYPDSVKIGMVSSAQLIEVISEKLKYYDAQNIVVDPVMISSSGAKLLQDQAIDALKNLLFHQATVLTPNIPEAEVLADMTIENDEDMIKAAKIIRDKYGCAVLCKGGHRKNHANDLLYWNDQHRWFKGERIDNPNNHGTGCTLSSSIASNLAKGMDLETSIQLAKHYVSGALRANLNLGKGYGPLNHVWDFK